MNINYICAIITESENITSSVIKFKYFSKHYWIGSVDAILYGFVDASGQGFGSTVLGKDGTCFQIGVWDKDT
jgi:hypothetical protein